MMICRGDGLKDMSRHLKNGFGCEGADLVGGFSTDKKTCERFASKGGEIGALYTAEYFAVQREYHDIMEQVLYNKHYFKAKPDVLKAVMMPSVYDDYLKEGKIEEMLDSATHMSDEKEVLFRVCPLHPFKDAEGKPLGKLRLTLWAREVVDKIYEPTRDYALQDERLCSLTKKQVDEYYRTQVEPLLDEEVLSNVQSVSIRFVSEQDEPFNKCKEPSKVPAAFKTIEGVK